MCELLQRIAIFFSLFSEEDMKVGTKSPLSSDFTLTQNDVVFQTNKFIIIGEECF